MAESSSGRIIAWFADDLPRGIRNLAVLVALRLWAGHAAQGRLRLCVKSDNIAAIIAVLKGGEGGRGGSTLWPPA